MNIDCKHERQTHSSAVVTGTNNSQCRDCGIILYNTWNNNFSFNSQILKPKSTNELLFDFIYQSVIEEGGDGDIVVGFIHQNYISVTEEFESFLLKKPCKWTKKQHEDHIIFFNDQEFFIFTNKESFDNIKNYGPRLLVW